MENDIRRHIGPLPQQILTTVMTNIVVDASIHYATRPLSMW